MIGLPFILSPLFAKNFLVSDTPRPLVETISPSLKKISVIFIACVNNPPGLFLKSKIYPSILAFFSNLLIDFKNSNGKIYGCSHWTSH